MKAIILAAGVGERLGPLTADLPKPMLEVAGRPVLEHNVRLLASYGITEVAINLHHRPDVIREHFGDGGRFGVQITYSFEEQLLGTAGALVPLEEWLDHDSFAVSYGDTYSTCDVARMVAQHREAEAMVTLAVVERRSAVAYGVVRLGEHGQVVGFVEKPFRTDLMNAGMMVCEASVLAAIPRYHGGKSDFGRDVLPKLIGNGAPVYAYIMRGAEEIWTIDTKRDLEATRLNLPMEADYEAMLRGGTA